MSDFSQYGGLSREFETLWGKVPKPPKQTLQELKDSNNQSREATSRAEMKPLGASITMKDFQISTRDGFTLDARTYVSGNTSSQQPSGVYIHFHGGGFLFGTLNSEDANCARIALAAPVVVLNVNYRHTPEFSYPTAWEDAEDAFEWAFNHLGDLGCSGDTDIVVGGISAGAYITAALVQTKQREPTPSTHSLKGQVLMIPCLVHGSNYAGHAERMKAGTVSSYEENEAAPILPRTRIDQFDNLVFARGVPDYGDMKANPGNATQGDVKDLPPTVIGVAGVDVLRDQGLLYAELLASSG